MYAVHFFVKKDLLLSQLLNNVPQEGASIKIKGRKGTVLSVTNIEENKFHVLLELEPIKKPAAVLSALDKKKRK